MFTDKLWIDDRGNGSKAYSPEARDYWNGGEHSYAPLAN